MHTMQRLLYMHTMNGAQTHNGPRFILTPVSDRASVQKSSVKFNIKLYHRYENSEIICIVEYEK